jgi:Pyridine nucleotide-disulphide oxidoreductase, dimerisation domain/Pyridine nucleotide-disulphide oxidoreductase
MASDYDVIVLGCRRPGGALRGRAGRGWPARRGRRAASASAASAPTGRASRPRRSCVPARRSTALGTRRRAPTSTSRPPWPGGISWSRTTTTPTPRAGSPTAGSTCSAAPAGWPAPAPWRSTACVTPRTTSCSRTAPTRSSRPCPACASWRASGAPARRRRCAPSRAGWSSSAAARRASSSRRRSTAWGRRPSDFVLDLGDGREVRGDRLLVATGRRPRVADIGLETVGIEADPKGVKVDSRLRAAEGVWALGDVNGIWPLTHVGEYEGDIVAANILGQPREAHYDAVPRVTYTDPQAAAVGAGEARFSATYRVADVPKAAAYTRAYAESNGFLALLSDGERLTGAYALGPEAGEWMQQATLAIRARVPLDVLRDTIRRSRRSLRSMRSRPRRCAPRSRRGWSSHAEHRVTALQQSCNRAGDHALRRRIDTSTALARPSTLLRTGRERAPRRCGRPLAGPSESRAHAPRAVTSRRPRRTFPPRAAAGGRALPGLRDVAPHLLGRPADRDGHPHLPGVSRHEPGAAPLSRATS